MKRIVVRYFVYMLILMILCIFVDLIPSILEDPHWLEFLGVMVVVCFLAASLDVSYSELMMSVKGAKPKKNPLFLVVSCYDCNIFSMDFLCYYLWGIIGDESVPYDKEGVSFFNVVTFIAFNI